MRGDRHRAGAERAHEQAGRRARRRARRRRRCRRTRAPRPRSCPARRARARGRAAASARRGGPGGDEHGRLPVELRGQPPQRAQEQPQRGALLLVDERDPHAPVVRRALQRRRARAQDAVVGREDPLHQLARRLEGGAARVEAAEEQLDEAPRDLGREHALGGRVERPDVERARVAQRDRRRAGRERLVDVDEVGRPDRERLLDRARDVERAARASRRGGRRRAAAARRRRAPARRRRGRTARRRGCAAATRARARGRGRARARRRGARRRPARPPARARRR